MEDDKKGEEVTESVAKEAPPEIQETVVEDKTETTEDIDFKKEAEELEAKTPRTELEKAKRALHFNAERVKELGGDPSEIIPVKGEPEGEEKPEYVTKTDMAQSYASTLVKSPDELKVIMWQYQHGIQRTGDIRSDIESAYLLAHKLKVLRSFTELKRANVQPGQGGGPGRKVEQVDVPERSPEEVRVLGNRGLKLNPKTKTYQGKIYEEYWDKDSQTWKSRKIPK